MDNVRASYHASPLRYPGGKAKLAPFFKALIRTNQLLDGTYVEPFAGGAGVGLCLLLHGYVERIFLNDLSAPVYAFWRAVLDEPERFQDRICEVELSPLEWAKQKRVFQEADGKVSFEVGFATFYLNRTNHSGVLNGGMIGGHAQKSAYNLDARFNRHELAARVKRIARNKSNINILNLDAAELLRNINQLTGIESPLAYIDPPYFRKGRDLYYDFYEINDHVKLRDEIQELNKSVRWVVSYDNEPTIREIYQGHNSFEYNLSYSVKNGRIGKEVMFLSERLEAPPLEHCGLQGIVRATQFDLAS